jgi:hypothetical protein
MKSGTVAAGVWLVAAGWAAAQGPAMPPAAVVPPASPPAAAAPNGYVTAPPAGPTSPFPTVGAPPGDAPYLPPESWGSGGGRAGPVFYADAAFLLYRVRAGNLPTTASALPVGVLNVTTTDPLTAVVTQTPVPVSITSSTTFGSALQYGSQNGARLNLGFWCDPEETWGLEAVGMFTQRGIDHFGAQGINSSPLSINTGVTPNVLVLTGGAASEVPGNPVVLVRQSQTTTTGSSSNDLYGGQLNARCIGLRIGCFDFGGLLGFRYLYFRDDVSVNSTTTLTQPPGVTDPAGSDTSTNLAYSSADRIVTYNHFYGGQLGVDMDAKFGSFFFYTRFTAAAGEMAQTARVSGVTQMINNDPLHPTPGSMTLPGGLLSAPGDQGSHTRSRISFIPEVNLKLGYQFTTWLRGYVGYDALDISSVARAGSSTVQTNFNSNVTVAGTTNTVSLAQPTFHFADSTVFVQGLTFGLQLMY